MSQNTKNLDLFKNTLQVEIYDALKKLSAGKSIGPDLVGIELTHPKEENHGDFSSSICLKISKIFKEKPIDIAGKINEQLTMNIEQLKKLGIEKVEVKPPGFINFWLTKEFLSSQLNEVLDKGDKFGENSVNPKTLEKFLKKLSNNIKIDHPPSPKASEDKKKIKVIVEFADPNPFKEFHIGHLRNISLGESFSRLIANLGTTVKRANYQGDVGSHVAKAIWGVRKLGGSWKIENGEWILGEKKIKTFPEKVKVLAEGYVLGSQAYEEDPEAKKQILTINVGIYKKEPELLKEWQEGRKISFEAFEKIYQRVGTKFDRYYFESEVAEPGASLVKEHLKDGVFQASEGAIIFDGEKFGLHKRVFVTKERYATYEAKDLALAVLKYKEISYDFSVITTASEQSEYFKVMLKALAQFRPDLAQRTLHVPFGMVNLKKGKMSSRTGKVITAEWLLDEAKKKAGGLITEKDYSSEEIEEITEKVALAAVKYSMLKFSPKSDIVFDFAESVSLEGDCGPYLLYTYTRCKSVLRRIKYQVLNIKYLKNVNINSEETALLRTIYKFPEVVFEAGVNFSPNIVCSYLFDLAQKYNLFYTKHSILTPKEGRKEVKEFRLALTAATAQILKNGLNLLGIPILEKM